MKEQTTGTGTLSQAFMPSYLNEPIKMSSHDLFPSTSIFATTIDGELTDVINIKDCFMNKEFIPYEQALELKELGFIEHCIAYYTIVQDKLIFSYTAIYDDGDEYIDLVSNGNPSNSKEFTAAPLYQQAFRWFREKHTYQCYIQFMNNSYAYWIGIKSIDFYYHSFNSTPRDMKIDSSWETYEEAELACLKKLIEIVKNK